MHRLSHWSASLLLGLAFAPAIYAAAPLNQEAKFADVSLPAGAHSGATVAISGDTAVVGAPLENSSSGAAYVYFKTGGVWALQEKLTASDGAVGDRFGAAVSIAGEVVAVGAPGRATATGSVYTFTRSGTDWNQDSTVLEGSSTSPGNQFGFSVSVQNTDMAVGAPFQTVAGKASKGAAYAFTNNGSGWVQQQRITENKKSVKGGAQVGWSVSLSGNTIAAGAPGANRGKKTNVGAVFIYVRNGTVWTRQVRLDPGGTGDDRVGSAVTLFSNALVIGADGSEVSGNVNQGVAYFETRTGTSWTLRSTLTSSDGAAHDHFGASVAMAGQFAVIGAPQDDPTPGVGAGKAYLFGFTGADTLSEINALVATDNAAGDNFGAAAAFNSNRALVGAPYADSTGVDAGAGYVFAFAETGTTTTIGTIAPEPSLTGQSYNVPVTVAATAGTAIGAVNVDDGDGATCTITLAAGAGNCNLVSVSPGLHTITANYSGTLVFASSSDTESHLVNGPDLGITKDDGLDGVVAGQHITYTIVVSNLGNTNATGAGVTDKLPAELLNGSWTCVASAGSACGNANGSGDINETVNVLAGGTATFTLQADVTGTLGPNNDVINTATVVPPGGFGDNNPNNDSVTDDDVSIEELIFADSFEDPVP